MRELFASPLRGLAAFLLAAGVACALAAFAFVPAALAAEGVTRSIDGLNYTLPADWEEIDAAQALAEVVDATGGAVEDNIDAIQAAIDELGLVSYAKGDGFFVALSVPGEELGVAKDDVDSNVAAMLAAYLQGMTQGTPLESVAVSSGTDQGLPIITATTTDISFNDVTYALTVQAYFNAGADASNVVVMMSFLPASGVVNDDVLASAKVLDEATTIDVGGIAYEIPAGVSLTKCSIFGFGFNVAVSEDPARGLCAFSVPGIDEFAGITVDDFDELAESIYDSVSSSSEATSVLSSFWAGAFSFLGYPTLGVEGVASEEDAEYAFCAMLSVTEQGVSILALFQDTDDTFVEDVVNSAQISDASGSASMAAASDASDASDKPGAGFIVGLPAA